MHIFGLEIRRDQREDEMTMVTCFRCARDYVVSKDNLRAYNYCSSCN